MSWLLHASRHHFLNLAVNVYFPVIVFISWIRETEAWAAVPTSALCSLDGFCTQADVLQILWALISCKSLVLWAQVTRLNNAIEELHFSLFCSCLPPFFFFCCSCCNSPRWVIIIFILPLVYCYCLGCHVCVNVYGQWLTVGRECNKVMRQITPQGHMTQTQCVSVRSHSVTVLFPFLTYVSYLNRWSNHVTNQFPNSH